MCSLLTVILVDVQLARVILVHTQLTRMILVYAQLFHHHHHQSLNCEGSWGTTDDFATSFLLFSLFSTALWDLPNSRPVHSLMLSSHLFLCTGLHSCDSLFFASRPPSRTLRRADTEYS